ncbi:MAG: lipopolysaccharide heptosyltransferase family protein, partial [Alphaproteobacteria bacterium]|nr:lipopolysaccharide heptosyltransferase family protein [Alphaproteobacteria bacterium]
MRRDMRLGRLIHHADGLVCLLGQPVQVPRGVLIVTSGGLGDTVLFSLVLPQMAAAVADAGEPVTVLLRSDAAKMAFLFPPEITVLSVDYKRLDQDIRYRLSLMARLRRAGFRVVVGSDYLRHPRLDDALIHACGAPQTLAMEPRSWKKHDPLLQRNRGRYTRLFDSGSRPLNKILRWTAFTNWLGGAAHPPPMVRLPESLLPPPASLAHPVILIQPFSAGTPKQSAPELYRAIMDALPDFDFVIKGGPTDLD